MRVDVCVGRPTRVGIFTDNDFAKINGVTTTLRSATRHSTGEAVARVYTASDQPAATPEYFATRSIAVGLPWSREMRIHWPNLSAFAKEIESDRVDVIHITTPGPVGFAGRLLARRLGLPAIGSYHAHRGAYVETISGAPRLGRLGDSFLRWFYERCDPLFVPSDAAMHELVRHGHRPNRLQIWPLGVDAQQFSPGRRSEFMRRMWNASGRRPAILYAGRLSREKGLDLLPAIRRRLAEWRIDHRLVLVGDGPMRDELRRTCPDALFLGTHAHDDVGIAMASADLLVFPSATATLGHVLLEAQASGLPVIVSDRGGAREHMTEGRSGWTARAGDADAFADRIAALVRDRETRDEMSRHARAFALTQTWQDALRPLTEAWKMAAGRHAQAGRRDASRTGRARERTA